MITCVVHYTIDPAKLGAFEEFAAAWIRLVNRHGGEHHGYFLPGEGASDQALALFTFPSLSFSSLFFSPPFLFPCCGRCHFLSLLLGMCSSDGVTTSFVSR